jgi:hypothetical protein
MNRKHDDAHRPLGGRGQHGNRTGRPLNLGGAVLVERSPQQLQAENEAGTEARMTSLLLYSTRSRDLNDVYELNSGDEVSCVHCVSVGDHTTYRRGQAYLAGPGHTPYNGEANYVCREHLDKDAVIHDVTQQESRS